MTRKEWEDDIDQKDSMLKIMGQCLNVYALTISEILWGFVRCDLTPKSFT
jgi:hypothetical protein